MRDEINLATHHYLQDAKYAAQLQGFVGVEKSC
jgi:hypothetical protein